MRSTVVATFADGMLVGLAIGGDVLTQLTTRVSFLSWRVISAHILVAPSETWSRFLAGLSALCAISGAFYIGRDI